MFGAIVGDIMGSSLEFEEQKFENIGEINLFDAENHFTDDTVLTLAVADWLLHDINNSYYDDEKLRIALGKRLVKWTHKYRDKEIAYGLSYMEFFYRAELTDEYRPQNSYGNGSAMRVSPIGWFFDTMEETMRFAKISADITHNHPEGQKGALAVSCAIFLARSGLALLLGAHKIMCYEQLIDETKGMLNYTQEGFELAGIEKKKKK